MATMAQRSGAAADPAGGVDDQAFIQRLAEAGQAVTVPARSRPYRLYRPIEVAAGTSLRFEAGAHIVYDPGRTAIPAGAPVGIFQLAGDGIAIEGRGDVQVRSTRPDANLYAVMGRGVRDVVIANVMAIDCAHAYITAHTEAYAQLVASGPGANLSARVAIRGGGARFAAIAPGAGHGACVISYCQDFTIRGCRYENVAHGIQWWGGDADPAKDGRLSNTRKCGPGRIAGITVTNAQGASVWGSMGRDIIVEDCSGRNAGDVGFDSEGGIGIDFIRCTQVNAKAGCFALFFENDAIRFTDCVAVQPVADQPVFRTYGKGSGDNRAVAIIGGRYSCTDRRPGVLDNANAVIADFTIRDAIFDNVVLQLEYRPFRRLSITGNRFSYPAAPTPHVVTMGVLDFPGQRSSVYIQDNEIRSPGAIPDLSLLIRFVGGDPRRFDRDIANNRTRPL